MYLFFGAFKTCYVSLTDFVRGALPSGFNLLNDIHQNCARIDTSGTLGPAGGLPFLFRQERKQRSRRKGGLFTSRPPFRIPPPKYDWPKSRTLRQRCSDLCPAEADCAKPKVLCLLLCYFGATIARGILKGEYEPSGARSSLSLKLISLVTFLFSDKKVTPIVMERCKKKRTDSHPCAPDIKSRKPSKPPPGRSSESPSRFHSRPEGKIPACRRDSPQPLSRQEAVP